MVDDHRRRRGAQDLSHSDAHSAPHGNALDLGVHVTDGGVPGCVVAGADIDRQLARARDDVDGPVRHRELTNGADKARCFTVPACPALPVTATTCLTARQASFGAPYLRRWRDVFDYVYLVDPPISNPMPGLLLQLQQVSDLRYTEPLSEAAG